MIKPKVRYKPVVLFVIVFLSSYQLLLGQQLNTELLSKLSVSDQKKLQKAEEEYAKGQKIENEINATTREERKSQLKFLEAADYYQKANSSKDKIYAENIKAFWKKFSGDKTRLDFEKRIEIAAADSFKNAQKIRSSAEKERKLTDRIRLLILAENLERKSLVMTQKVLFSYLNWPVEVDRTWVTTIDQSLPPGKAENKQVKTLTPKETKKDSSFTKEMDNRPVITPFTTDKKSTDKQSGNDSSLYGKVKISEDQIDKFNSFLEKKYPSKYEDYVINFQQLDYSDINALKEAWYKYQFGYAGEDSSVLAARQDSVSKEQQPIAVTRENKSDLTGVKESDIKSKAAKQVGNQYAVESKPDKSIVKEKGKTEKKTISGVESKSEPSVSEITSEAARGFTFRVQIVACRVPLDKKTLNGIYDGPLQILELIEDNWYKYAIGEFTTYNSARQLRDKSTIPGAFVIAYLNGKRIKITPVIAYKNYKGNIKKEDLNADLISYRIQIAASKTLLSANYLKNIYSGSLKIEMIREDGWNKYYLPAGETYEGAKNLLKQIAVPGAFILAYQQNKRIDVQAATKLTK
ncbi:MAG TPA: hypothetical protein VIH57_19215 [Bacteroidales bacterium]